MSSMDKLLAYFYISDYTIVPYLYIYFGRCFTIVFATKPVLCKGYITRLLA